MSVPIYVAWAIDGIEAAYKDKAMPVAFRVMAYLASRMRYGMSTVSLVTSDAAEAVGATDRQVRNVLRMLENSGHILEVEREVRMKQRKYRLPHLAAGKEGIADLLEHAGSKRVRQRAHRPTEAEINGRITAAVAADEAIRHAPHATTAEAIAA